MTFQIRTLQLSCSTFSVDARFVRINGRWIASVDTPEGPTLGHGPTAFAALWMALQPFEGVIDELLASVPTDALLS
ncbi:MAG TPA: hypothetical protein VKU35_01790 [Candidatus Limnocylindria bacterium]|nr:hypothetical protein [Candidatus Limnocylindria bacterium]